jgi:phosphatidylglycerophosphate synthase
MFLKDNIYVKYIIGFLFIFIFIIQHGCWSFYSELQNHEKVDWSNGNTFNTLIYAFGLYFIFIIISKMKLIPNLLVLGLLLLMYILNSQREFLQKSNVITNKDN